MSAITGALAASILPALHQADSAITNIAFLFGTVKEIIETIKQFNASPVGRFKLWPAVILYTDLSEIIYDKPGKLADVTLHLATAYPTEATYTPDERYSINYEPILYPLWQNLIKQIAESGCFTNTEKQISYVKYDRLFWGNKLAAKVDAIELMNMKLKLIPGAKPRPVQPTQRFFQADFFDNTFFQ